jgi:hypothetical protein
MPRALFIGAGRGCPADSSYLLMHGLLRESPVFSTLSGDTVGVQRAYGSIVTRERVSGTPIWFRLWADREGLAHRAQMRALGHFMDHRYYGFRSAHRHPPAGAAALDRMTMGHLSVGMKEVGTA